METGNQWVMLTLSKDDDLDESLEAGIDIVISVPASEKIDPTRTWRSGCNKYIPREYRRNYSVTKVKIIERVYVSNDEECYPAFINMASNIDDYSGADKRVDIYNFFRRLQQRLTNEYYRR